MLTDDLCLRIISSCFEDARDIAKVRGVCKGFNEAGKNVISIRYVCREIDHEKARRKKTIASTPSQNHKAEASEKDLDDNVSEDATTQRDAEVSEIEEKEHDSHDKKELPETNNENIPGEFGDAIPSFKSIGETGDSGAADEGQASSSQRNTSRFEPALNSTYGKGENSKSSCKLLEGSQQELLFRQAVEQDLLTKSRIIQLRIEIESKLQSKSVGADEREHSDFWLSDPVHLNSWVPSVALTLQHLCIVDYGHQAIVRVSSILKILSHNCNHLKTIDLRNMCIDTNECTEMRELTSFTLRCVKINGDALNDFSDKMKNLQTLALLGVFGIDTGNLKLQQLKILCLGLSTKAKVVTMELPSLTKLQLKMACPEDMSITAPNLKYVAFNLEVPVASNPEGVPGSLALRFVDVRNMQELLYGASKFVALSDLVMGNRYLNKLFLDIPCMALGEDGKWLGVLKDVSLNIPSFTTLQQECPNLEVLNIGPGLWYSMESNIEILKNVRRWPGVQTLILQMIPQKMETSVMLLKTLVAEIDTLVNLEIFVHTSSPVDSGEFFELIQDQVQHLNLRRKSWKRSLDFSCFTF